MSLNPLPCERSTAGRTAAGNSRKRFGFIRPPLWLLLYSGPHHSNPSTMYIPQDIVDLILLTNCLSRRTQGRGNADYSEPFRRYPPSGSIATNITSSPLSIFVIARISRGDIPASKASVLSLGRGA